MDKDFFDYSVKDIYIWPGNLNKKSLSQKHVNSVGRPI